MKLTADKFFADSNILIYLLSDVDYKKLIAKQILNLNPVISTQVVAENVNVIFKKFGTLSTEQLLLHKAALLQFCELVLIDRVTIDLALEIKIKHKYQWYDSLIVASALQNNCKVLYSEDMQHLRVFENTLTIVNPFVE